MVPMQRGLTEVAAVRAMADALVKMGAKAAVLDASASGETTEWFNRFEAEHDIVFYQGDEPDSSLDEPLPSAGRPHHADRARR